MKIKRLFLLIFLVVILILCLFIYNMVKESKDEIKDSEKNETEEIKEEPKNNEEYSAEWIKENPIKGAVINLENPPSLESLKDLKNFGADFVYVQIYDFWSVEKPYSPEKSTSNELENLLEDIEESNLKAILVPMTGPGKDDSHSEIFYKYDAQEAWEMMLQDLLYETKDNPSVIGWSIMGKPNPDKYFLEEDSSSFKKSSKIWINLTDRYINVMRDIDSNKLIVISPLNSESIEGLLAQKLVKDENVIYTVSFIEPRKLILQDEPPFEYLYNKDAEEKTYTRRDIISLIDHLTKFKKENNVAILISEYGAVRYIPGIEEYLSDLVEIFENEGFSHAYYGWDEIDDTSKFTLEYGINIYNEEIYEDSKVFKPILESWEE